MTVPGSSSPEEGRARPVLGLGIGLLALAYGIGLGAGYLLDNSFLTHLATGRLILAEGSVPSADPYSFTASGADWTVQSWLPSVVDALAERALGVGGLRLVSGALTGAAALLVWRLTRPAASLLPRLALAGVALFIGGGLWGPRPYMLGVIGLGLVWLALDRAVPAWAMVPLFWVWANGHGSFPLGVGLAVLVVAGRWIDDRTGDGDTGDRGTGFGGTGEVTLASEAAHERRVLGFAVLGSLAAVLGPLGPRVLLFPLTALRRADVLREINEWKPATFQELDERLFLLLAAATVVGLAVRRRRGSVGVRDALPVTVFLVAAMLAQRNLVMALVVLVPVAARCAPSVGSLRSDARSTAARAVAAVGAVAVLASVVVTAGTPLDPLESRYPAHALAWMDDHGDRVGGAAAAPLRIAAPDTVGNLREALDGTDVPVFIDDRVDMYPDEVIEDSLILLRGRPAWSSVLDEHRIDVVLWPREQSLASLLAGDGRWRTVWQDGEWLVACRRGACPLEV